MFQSNDLAKAFGNLTTKQHQLLDFATSYVTKNSTVFDTYETTFSYVLKHLGLTASGSHYANIANSFKALYEKTNLMIKKNDSLVLDRIFGNVRIDLNKDTISFYFDKYVWPDLVVFIENFYSINFSILYLLKINHFLV